jgi:uncharacterized protein (DUF362 family)
VSASSTRREFLARMAAVAAGATALGARSAVFGGWERLAVPARRDSGSDHASGSDQGAAPRPSVVVARDEALAKGEPAEQRDLLVKVLNAAMLMLTSAQDAAAAWRKLFKPSDRVGIKVNTLGLSTRPAVVDAIVAGLRLADVPAANIVIWDRFDTELGRAGFTISKSAAGVRCRGTDAESYGSGYRPEIEQSGAIGSAFSRIVADQVDALISVPVLKDHNLAGVSLGMKNFYGAIHNPNKYHDHNCDPFIVDVVAHRYIRPKWRLTVCDGLRAQCHAGPGRNPSFIWPFGGLVVGTDFVATDAVATSIIEEQRAQKKLKTLADDGRPVRHIATAAARGLGIADLSRIERVEI